MNPIRRKTIHDAMARLSDGDRSAFPILVDELWPVILAFAERGMGQRADAEDVAQEVFLRICSRISDFNRDQDGLSWAFAIASYAMMSHRKKRQRNREVPDDSELANHRAGTGSPEDMAIQREIAAALTSIVGNLSHEDLDALGLTGVALGKEVTAATLRKRRQRALLRVRAVWRKIYGEP
jgi:RNA polymerase sigma-70 factor (ECF subfamily)